MTHLSSSSLVVKLALATGVLSVLGGCGGGATPAAEQSVEATAIGDVDAAEAPAPSLASASLGGGEAIPSLMSDRTAEASSAADQSLQLDVPDQQGLAVAGPAAVTTAIDIHVSPTGNDAWSGNLVAANAAGTDGPVRTLPVAQSRARARIAAMVSSGARVPLRVRIQPGTYVLSSPLTFVSSDSGGPGAPVSYEAVTAGTVTVSGGATLRQLTAGSAGVPAVFENPPAGQNAWRGGGQLFVNSQRAVLARTPNVGNYWFIQKAYPLATEPVGQAGRAAFTPTPDALSQVNALSVDDRSRAIVNVMHAWTSSQHRLVSTAPVGVVQLTPSARWTFLNSGTSQRYWLENVPGALDAPGEFYWDASGIRYLPKTAEVAASLNAVMPVLDRLVVVTGDIANAKWVDNLQFRGITFSHTRSLIPSGGQLDWQAAADVGAAIEVDGATNLIIDNCSVNKSGGYGVWLRRAVRGSRVTNSTFTDLGAGGIKLGQVSQLLTDVLQTGANVASGNRVGETGKTHPGAVGIWVGNSFDNTVSNNLVYNTSYGGISVGWTWGYGPAASGRNTVADNLLINIGMGQLADMGAIYLVGVSPGTRITGNVIREVRGYPGYGAGVWGIYGDSGSSQLTIANNIVLGTDAGSLQITMGRSNTAQYNLLGWGELTEVNISQPDAQTVLAFSDNTLVPKAVKPFLALATSPNMSSARNEVAVTYSGKQTDLSMCGAGCISSSSTVTTTTDPRGVSLTSNNAAQVANVAQTAAKAGPLSLTNASSVVLVATQKPQVLVAPPITFELNIAGAALGTQPLGLWYSSVGVGSPITVVADAAAPGGRCLQYTDSPANANGYDPHTYAPMNHGTGTTTGEFSLLIDAQTNMVHQWRDKGAPALTGPALTVTASGVYVANKLVAPVSVGQWMKFKVIAPLAGTGTTWSLQVTNASGATTTVNSLPFVHAAWGSLNWWGFVSNAKVTSKMCIAEVRATNVQ